MEVKLTSNLSLWHSYRYGNFDTFGVRERRVSTDNRPTRKDLNTGQSKRGKSQIIHKKSLLCPAMKSAAREDCALTPSARVLNLWRNADAVCFDVDSTLCEDESIDELAAYLGCGEEVAELTSKAMGGSLKFEETLAARLDLMQPSIEIIKAFLQHHPPKISEGIPELVKALNERGKAVFLVSGGFRVIIDPIADILSIPRDHVFANNIIHKADGSYSGFDAEEMTSRSGGKLRAIMHIKERYDYQVMAMVGDGATDLEARHEGGADIFVGYGGTVVRPTIASKADWFVLKMQSLIDAL